MGVVGGCEEWGGVGGEMLSLGGIGGEGGGMLWSKEVRRMESMEDGQLWEGVMGLWGIESMDACLFERNAGGGE